jgi:hypothetical protein
MEKLKNNFLYVGTAGTAKNEFLTVETTSTGQPFIYEYKLYEEHLKIYTPNGYYTLNMNKAEVRAFILQVHENFLNRNNFFNVAEKMKARHMADGLEN